MRPESVVIITYLLFAFAAVREQVDGYKLVRREEYQHDTMNPVRRKRFIFANEDFNWFTATCLFPFWYNGRQFWRCIKDDALYLWCATTDDFNRDGLWRWCMNLSG